MTSVSLGHIDWPSSGQGLTGLGDMPGESAMQPAGLSSQYWLGQQQVQAANAQIASNSTRPARCVVKLESRATGSGLLDRPITFNMVFIYEPSVVFGVALAPGQGIKDDIYPLVTLGVHQWQRNDKGFFTGAHVFGSVQLLTPLGSPNRPPSATELAALKRTVDAKLRLYQTLTPHTAEWNRAIADYKIALAALQDAQKRLNQKAGLDAIVKAGGYVLHHYVVFETVAMKLIPGGAMSSIGSGQSVAPGGRV